MYVQSFFLTTDPPETPGGMLVIGEMSDGVVAVSEFPADARMGAVIEIAADEDDEAGTHEVEVVIEYSHLNDEQAPIGEPFAVELLPLEEDWWGPRTTPQPLAFSLRFWDEFEGYLVVKIDGEELAEHALRVVLYDIPDQLP